MSNLKTLTDEEVPERGENDWDEYSEIALNNLLSDESAARVTSKVDKNTSEMVVDLLSIYAECEIHIIAIKSLWKNLLLKSSIRDQLKIKANQQRMIDAIKTMRQQLEPLLRVALRENFDTLVYKAVEFKKIRDEFKKVDKSIKNRDAILSTILKKFQNLDVHIPTTYADISKTIESIIATEKMNWRILVEKQPLDNEMAMQCLNIINKNQFWRNIKSALLVEKIFNSIMNGVRAVQEDKKDYLFMTNTLLKFAYYKSAADDMSHLSKQQRQDYAQRINFYTAFIRLADRCVKSLADDKDSKQDSAKITAMAKDSISVKKWEEISNNLIDNLVDNKRYEVIEETDKKISVRDHDTKSNIVFNKFDRSIQAVLPTQWFDTKLDNKQIALIKVFLEQVHTLPIGTVVRIGNCSAQPEVAIILDQLVRKSGLEARYDEKDGTKAAVDSLPPARSLRAAQAKSKRTRKKIPIVSKKRKRIEP